MSARPVADAALVVEFLNTLDVETRADELTSDASWRSWAERHGLPRAGAARQAAAARDALRAAVDGRDDVPDLTVPVVAGIVDGQPGTGAHDALGAVLLAAARLADAGAWPRVKLCASETCRWAFVDESRNRSRAWCSMQVCGNRAKARTFRARAKSD